MGTDDTAPYLAFHKSLTDELHAVKDRIRDLVKFPTPRDYDDETRRQKTHWLTDGEWKEAALRSVLRRHLLDAAPVGRGFVVNPTESTTQIDLLIPKPAQPTLFRDDDLLIVTADAVSAVAEEKTALKGPEAITKALLKLARIGEFCEQVTNENPPWMGLFVYDGEKAVYEDVLDAVASAYQETAAPVNCVSFGRDLFVRYWGPHECDPGEKPDEPKKPRWKAYNLVGVAASYFVGNIVSAVCGLQDDRANYAWFAYPKGKSPDGKRYLGKRLRPKRTNAVGVGKSDKPADSGQTMM